MHFRVCEVHAFRLMGIQDFWYCFRKQRSFQEQILDLSGVSPDFKEFGMTS
jgi:hypothetical protein